MKKKFFGALTAAALISVGIITSAGAATADPCLGTWSIGIGGLNDNTSATFGGGRVNQQVGYNSLDPVSGRNEINRLFFLHRSQCPNDHIKLIGHSEGAALVHVWVTEHQGVKNANAVLLADPKRYAPGYGGNGWAAYGGFLGYPLAGVDNWFGSFPVLTICRASDYICDTDAPWFASSVNGVHGAYDFNSHDYNNTAHGAILLP